MLTWYRENAPSRQKLAIAVMTGLTVLTAASASLGTLVGGLAIGLEMGLTCAVASAFGGAWCRSLIADPYVTTVVRMEALAAGDLTGPIEFTYYSDCAGRLTQCERPLHVD